MHRNIFKGLGLIAAIFSLLIPHASFPQDILVNPAMENVLELTDNTYQRLGGMITTGTVRNHEIQTEQGKFTRISIPGYARSLEPGKPELPVKRELIEIPVGAEPVVKITSASHTIIDLSVLDIRHPLYPLQPPRSKSDDQHDFIYDETAYQTDRYFQEELVSVDVIGFMRSTRIARLNIAPVRYNPVTHQLMVYDNIRFEILFENADTQATLDLKKRLASIYFEPLNNLLLNYKPLSNRENFTRYPVKYVIIADRMFETQLQPLIEWKKQKGFTVVEAYTDEQNVGSSLASIKAYIQSLYDAGTPEDPAPSFVVFAGDIEQIPSYDNGNGVTDRNYCEFTGDLLPEIFYGRFSAQNEDQFQPYIDKTIEYEKYTMPDPSYLDEVVLVSGVDAGHGHDWGNGQINYGTTNYFNQDHGILAHDYLYPESGSSSAQIIQNISDGVTFGNYTAHCSPNGWADPSFTISDIASLENESKYGVLVGNCCSSSEYQVSECFAEALLRAENKGSVGYIGASNSTYWDEDYYYAVGVGEISEIPPPYEETTLGSYDRSFHDHGEPFEDWFVTADQMIYAGNLAVLEGSPGMADYYWDIYNLMGDPSLMVYFSEPPVMAVNYDELLPLSSTTFVVNTEPYAYVALSRDGVLHGADIADETGFLELPITPFSVPGPADVIVTKQNGEPYFGTVTVANPNGAFLVLKDFIIEDSLGNNNHHADYNELVSLTMELENLGNADATNTQVSISSADPNIILTDDYQEWGIVQGLSTASQENAFTFQVQEDIEDQHIVVFDMVMEAEGKETWTTDFSVTLNRPVLSIREMIIDDSEFGNGNGRLDPGETADLKIKNKNTGHCITENAVATLNAYNAYVTFENTTDTIGALGLLGFKYATFTVHVHPETPNGCVLADFIYHLEAGPFQADKTFRRKLGLIYDDFETGDFEKFDWEMGGNEPWTITDVFPYEGIYSAKSGTIEDGQTSTLSLTLNVMTADSITFIKKVSSQSNQDKLKFFIDNTLKGEWSGTSAGWQYIAVPAPTGSHTYKWVYQKDGQGSAGSDCGWLDFVVMPPLMALTCYAGPDDVCCETNDYLCQGEATAWQTADWTTSGTGTFNDPSILQPLYTPSNEDIEDGSVELTLTVTGSQGDSFQDVTKITFITIPETPDKPSGPDNIDWISMPVSFYETNSVPHTTAYNWVLEPSDAGTSTGTGTTCRVVWNEEYSGFATLNVQSTNGCGDSEFSESLEITVNNPVGLHEIQDQKGMTIYPNPGRDRFTVHFTTPVREHVDLRVFTVVGSIVYEEQLSMNSQRSINLTLGSLPAGLYFIAAEGAGWKTTKKLIINK
ncbi:MAG: C25 family cysteine peptidase [Bacteroidales bacterium]